MNLSTCRHRNQPDDGKITFPKLQCWNPMTKVVTIAADVNGKRVSCRISGADIMKKFMVAEDASMQAVTQNRAQIETAARTLIENKNFEEDGSILIEYQHL